MPIISLIAAVAEGGVIGQNGAIPWHLPADLKRFKKLTTGHPVVMGRKTFGSIVDTLGRALPGRTNIVLTHRKVATRRPDHVIVNHLVDALVIAQFAPGGDTEIFIIGGAEIYTLALPLASRFYLTEVRAVTHPGKGENTYFPLWNKIFDEWCDAETPERHSMDEKNKFDYTFRILERKEDG